MFLLQIIIELRFLLKKNADEANKSTQDQTYKSVLNNLKIPISILDQFQNYVFINDFELYNYNLNRYLIGRNDFDYATKFNFSIEIAQKRQILFNKVVREKIAYAIEEMIVLKNGEIKNELRWMIPVFEGTTVVLY